MAHEIEISESGAAAFVSSRVPAWHRLGTTVDADLTVEEGLKIGHLADWNVRKMPLSVNQGVGKKTLKSDLFATVRDNPFEEGVSEILGVGLTDSYTVVQNEEAAQFLQNLLDTDEVVLDAAGSLRGGKRAFMTLRLPEAITIEGTEDQVMPYLVGAWSHDGSMSVHAMVRPTRVVCANTLSIALGQRTAPTVQIRHTGTGLEGKLAEAKEILGVVHSGIDEFSKVAAEWAARDVSAAEFDSIVAGLFPHADSGKGIERVDSIRDQYRWLYEEADTQAGIRDSAWGALNAYTEWTDWYQSNPDHEVTDERAVAQISRRFDKKRVHGATIIANRLDLAMAG